MEDTEAPAPLSCGAIAAELNGRGMLDFGAVDVARLYRSRTCSTGSGSGRRHGLVPADVAGGGAGATPSLARRGRAGTDCPVPGLRPRRYPPPEPCDRTGVHPRLNRAKLYAATVVRDFAERGHEHGVCGLRRSWLGDVRSGASRSVRAGPKCSTFHTSHRSPLMPPGCNQVRVEGRSPTSIRWTAGSRHGCSSSSRSPAR